MSQWSRLPSGSKGRSHFIDHEQLGSYRFPPSHDSHTSQSSEASTSPHSSQEGHTLKTFGKLPSLTARIGTPSDVGNRIDASFQASSSIMRLPATSPTSSATFTLPPIAVSSPRPAPYTNDSGNLPHRLGADHFSTQRLQHENKDLATAYTQAQIYIADLDTRFQACHGENVKLAKDRQRLTSKIELLEAQLEEMEHSVQQTQKHTASKDAQYSRIMELSTRLQSQGAAESQARKAEQHEWFREKKSMQSVIQSLKTEVNSLRKAYASCTRLTDPTPSSIDDCSDGIEDNPDSSVEFSSHELIAEIETLRRANARMEDALVGVRGDKAQLVEYIEKLGSLEKSIRMRLQKAETARVAFDSHDDEEGGEGTRIDSEGMRIVAGR